MMKSLEIPLAIWCMKVFDVVVVVVAEKGSAHDNG